MTLPAVAPEAVVVKLEPGHRYILRPPADQRIVGADLAYCMDVLKEARAAGHDLILCPGWTVFDATGAEVGMEETQG